MGIEQIAKYITPELKEEAAKINNTIFEWFGDINDHLPNPDGSYEIEWDLDSGKYVHRVTLKCISDIKDTVMGGQILYELTQVNSGFSEAEEKKDITMYQRALANACTTFAFARNAALLLLNA